MERIEKELEVHAFVCTNEKPEGKACCKRVGGMEFFSRLKDDLKAKGIYSTHKVTKSGCLGYCNDAGCTITIYRKGQPEKWFTEVKMEDYPTIWETIVNDK